MRRLLALLLAVFGLFAVAVPVAAQEDTSGSTTLVVHEVDARQANTSVSIISDSYQFNSGDVRITHNGDSVDPSKVTTASQQGVRQEIVFVVDANSALSAGGVFNTVKTELSSAIKSLPAGTTVSVVSAGVIPTVSVQKTTNLQAASAAVMDMTQSGKTSLFGAVQTAGTLLSPAGDAYQTVVVFSGSVDSNSSVNPLEAGQSIISKNAQFVVARYDGGDDRLAQIVDVAGGISIGTSDAEGVGTIVQQAVTAASDRIIVEFAGVSESGQRGETSISIGETTVDFAYPGSRLTTSIAGLAPLESASGSRLGFLHSTMSLYILLGLAFVGIGVAVFFFGSIFAGGETSLEGLINRYSGEGDGVLDEEESAIVQTALVRRAVEMSETFAEERGFLAKIERMLERARLPLRPGEAMSIYLTAIFFSGAIGFIVMGGLVGTVLLASMAGFLQIAGVQFVAKRRIKKFEGQLPDTLQLLASTLRAGYSLPQGFEAVSHEIADPMGFELRRAMTEARLGRELEEALAGIAERLESEDFAWVVMAIGIQREVGGNLNELLMTVSDTMIARERLAGEVAALTAEGKMSAIMLGGMPPLLGLVMWVMNKEYMNQLFITGIGQILLGIAVVSSLIGFVWMKKVITVHV